MRTSNYYDTDIPEEWSNEDLKHEVNALGFVYDVCNMVTDRAIWIDIRTPDNKLVCRIYKYFDTPHFTTYAEDLSVNEEENMKELISVIRRYIKGRKKQNESEDI